MVLNDKTIVVYIHCGWIVEFTQGNINLLGITYDNLATKSEKSEKKGKKKGFMDKMKEAFEDKE